MKKELVFSLPRTKTLNSNTMNGMHYIVKGKLASSLRELGFQEGLAALPEEYKEAALEKKSLLTSEENNKQVRSRLTKQMKKDHPGATKKTIEALVATAYAQTFPEQDKAKKSSEVAFTPLFHKFKVSVFISSPSNRRFDPPNFWPTVKPLIDGLTDACYWEDDDWTHLQETSFLPDGVNTTKTDFIFRLVIEELPPTKS